jgi:hypothetical protein
MIFLQGTGVIIMGAGGNNESDRIIINANAIIADKIMARFWVGDSVSS